MTSSYKPPREHYSYLTLLYPLLYMGLLYFLSSIPGTPDPAATGIYRLFLWLPSDIENLLHIPAYAGLAWVWRWALAGWPIKKSHLLVLSVALSAVYAPLDEWHQLSVPGRDFSYLDMAFDVLGACAGVWIYERYQRLTKVPK